MLTRLALVAVASALCATPALAQKEKKADLSGFPFWSAPKTPHARAFVPGLNAALELTPEQVEKIAAAIDATVGDPELRKLPNKNDPNATPDELAKAAVKRAEAAEKLYKEIDKILTTEQKALIEKVNDAYARVVSEVGEEFAPKLVEAKGNPEDTAALRKEQAEAIVTTFNKKLDALLSTDQKAAVKKAAEEEAKRAAAKPDKPKK